MSFEIRPAASAPDLELWLEVWNAVEPDEAITVPDLQSWISQMHDDTRFVALDGGVVGAAAASLEHERGDAVVHVVVARPRRRRGIGSALYAAVSDWARERRRAQLETSVGDEGEGLDFATKRGFSEIGRNLRVALDLRHATPAPVPPPTGVEIVTWADRPETARGMYDVAVEALPDIPGEDDEPVPAFDDWLANHMTGSGDRADATFVALHGDEVVGYAKFSLADAQPKTAHHDLTGVRRAWRGRGVARALKSAQIEWARANGYERLVTANEERNAPIRKLNAEFGYEPAGARIRLRGPLSGAT